MKDFIEWIKAKESSAFTRLRRNAALGLMPPIPAASVNSRSTASPFEVEKLTKKKKKCKKKKKIIKESTSDIYTLTNFLGNIINDINNRQIMAFTNEEIKSRVNMFVNYYETIKGASKGEPNTENFIANKKYYFYDDKFIDGFSKNGPEWVEKFVNENPNDKNSINHKRNKIFFELMKKSYEGLQSWTPSLKSFV